MSQGIGSGSAAIPSRRAPQRGTLHILRNFHDMMDKTGVYDVAYTRDDSAGEPDPKQRIRRFYGPQELSEFLKNYLHRDPKQVRQIVDEVEQNGRARLPLDLPDDELRKLDLAA
jgi:hypothetical protein